MRNNINSMRMKAVGSFVPIVLLLLSFTATAQVAVVPMGGHAAVGNAELSVSLGQCATQTVYDTAVTVSRRTASLTEGVLQPYLTIELAIPDGVVPLACTLNLFPNPTSRSLTVEADGQAPTLRYTLYTLSGQTLQEGSFQQRTTLDVEELPSGHYMLRVEDSDRGQQNVYKIVKVR